MQRQSDSECPQPMRGAFLDLLTTTLLYVRAEVADTRFCFALADHAHNVPELLGHFEVDRLRYYWEVERPCFLRALGAIDRRVPPLFEEAWRVIEGEYRRLCVPSIE